MLGRIRGFHCKVHEHMSCLMVEELHDISIWLLVKGDEIFALNVLAALDALNLSQARCILAPFMRGTNCFATKL